MYKQRSFIDNSAHGDSKIPMNDFKLQYHSIKEELKEIIDQVLESGYFILGDMVESFEREFAEYCGATYGVGVNSGLDALRLALVVLGIGPGDEVITVANSAVATALAITHTGAKPVFVDVDKSTYNIDLHKIEEKVTRKTKAILPVHLFGNPADMESINEIAENHDLWVVEDACQSHGAEYKGKKTGTLGDVGCFSFYPTKNLGAYGDGGMVLTNDKEICERIKMLRNYGQTTRYKSVFIGFNSRLDEMQAAILRVKLRHLNRWNDARRRNAKAYNELLLGTDVMCPVERENVLHVYHLYVIQSRKRNQLQNFLASKGITTLIHYPIPIHLQDAYKELKISAGTLPVTEELAKKILSLPIYPEMTRAQIQYVADSIRDFARRNTH